MPISDIPIFCYYSKERFTQYGPMDCANWYGIQSKDSKKVQALYPCMGRKHIEFMGQNKLVFTSEPRAMFKTINFMYVIIGTQVIQVDRYFNEKVIGNVALGTQVWFDYLAVGTTIYGLLTDEQNCFIITEDSNPVTMVAVTDGNRPTAPQYVAAFGNRFVVSGKGSPDYYLTQIDLGTPANCFTVDGAPLFNRASGIIVQFGVLHNQLYIFCNFQTDVWANIPSNFISNGVVRQFPWKQNTSYNFDFGLYDPFSLSIEFGMMVFLAQNKAGLVSFMMSTGQRPEDISSQAINVLLENSRSSTDEESPFLIGPTNGFLYQYENTIFYRVSAGSYLHCGELDRNDSANCIEFNFATGTWGRAIELNGERNRIQKHVFFNNKHIVSVQDDGALYEMAGNIYRNELRRADTESQAPNAFVKYPMRYVLVTKPIFQPDYSEFRTEYVEIDFVFGDKTFYYNETAFDNTVFVITEDSDRCGCPIYVITEDANNGQPVFVITEDGNTPTFDDIHYNQLFKPSINLYFSDDGGITFYPTPTHEFSRLGQYRWRMRWYRLGVSRNRVYKLVCVSSAPIVILGAVQSTSRTSGGAN